MVSQVSIDQYYLLQVAEDSQSISIIVGICASVGGIILILIILVVIYSKKSSKLVILATSRLPEEPYKVWLIIFFVSFYAYVFMPMCSICAE